MKSLNKTINPSRNTNPFNHNTDYIKLYTSVKDGTSDKDEFGQLINPRYLDDVFNFKTNLSPPARKVRVDLGRKELLVMREVQVFDFDGVNVARNKAATQSNLYKGGSPASNAVDGDVNTISHTDNNISETTILPANFPSILYRFNPLLTSLLCFYINKDSWWEVDLGADVPVKSVKIYNRAAGGEGGRLSWAVVSLIDNAGKTLETHQLGNANGIYEFDISFGLSDIATSVRAWKTSPSPTGEPLLSDPFKTQLREQFKKDMDIFDTPIALVFGNKTTIGQVCSFAKGLASKNVTNIPGFCCLDAPYQSKIEEWGEKVSSWDARMKKYWYCDVPEKLTTWVYHESFLAKSTVGGLMGVNM